MNTPLPMPVPSVTTANGAGATLAGAEGHLRDAGRVRVVDHGDVAAGRLAEQFRRVEPIQPGSMFAAVRATPLRITAGRVIPTARSGRAD